jgi:hypothetical protein
LLGSAPLRNSSSSIAFNATTIVAFARAKITNLGMLHLRNGDTAPDRSMSKNTNRRLYMERIYRAIGLAVALGTSGLMFALTLA